MVHGPLSTLASLWYSTSALGQTGKKGDEKMRITATAATVTILVVLFAGKVSAWEAESGNELYELLVSKSPYSRFVAEGYILGVIDKSVAPTCTMDHTREGYEEASIRSS